MCKLLYFKADYDILNFVIKRHFLVRCYLLYYRLYLFFYRSGEDEGFSLGWEIEEKEIAGVGRVGTVGEAG